MMKHTLPTLLMLALTAATLYGQQSPYGDPVDHPNGRTPALTSQYQDSKHGDDSKHRGAGTLAAGDTWLPMAGGLSGNALFATVMNDQMYVLYEWVAPKGDSNCAIVKWTGTGWETVTTFVREAAIYSFGSYHGELYLGGLFTNIEGLTKINGLIRWDGNTWHSVGSGLTGGAPNAIMEYQGDLYIAGDFDDVDGLPGTAGIARWDGKQWNSVGDGLLYNDAIKGVYCSSLTQVNGKLYVGGAFTTAGGIPSRNLAEWDGTRWGVLPITPDREVMELAVYKGELVAFGPSITQCGDVPTQQIARWNGKRWASAGAHGQWRGIRGMVEYQGGLYAAGAGERGHNVGHWNGATWDTLSGTFDNVPTFVEAGGGNLVVGGWFTMCGQTPVNHVALMCNDHDCGSITGTIYEDNDKDCTMGAGDVALERRVVMVQPGGIYATTDASGHYSQRVLPGAYTISLVPRLHWPQTCPQPSGTYDVTVATAGQQFPGLDFAMRAMPNVKDLRVSIVASRARPGRPMDYYITYENVGTVTTSGSLMFTFDSRLTPVGSAPAANHSSPGSLFWNFTDLRVDERRMVHVSSILPTTVPTGNTICAYAWCEFDNGPDLYFRHDDRDSICVTVTNACDPNDIAVAPLGIEGDGEIEPGDSVLSYTIRFQNTGTDTAFRIVVVDTLSQYHDPASIRLGTASHPYTFSMNGPGVLTFTFDNVMLPDSNASEPNSHGVLKYFVRLRPDLPSGTTIPNRAAIYFDYNAAVGTNTVISTITGSLGVNGPAESSGIMMAPNPSTGLLRIEGRLVTGGTIAVMDLLGNRLMTAPVAAPALQTLDLRGLAAGTYLIALPTPAGTVMGQVVLVR